MGLASKRSGPGFTSRMIGGVGGVGVADWMIVKMGSDSRLVSFDSATPPGSAFRSRTAGSGVDSSNAAVVSFLFSLALAGSLLQAVLPALR